MSWRPANWDEIKPVFMNQGFRAGLDEGDMIGAFNVGREAGADAMLEVLLGRNRTPGVSYRDGSFGKFLTVWMPEEKPPTEIAEG